MRKKIREGNIIRYVNIPERPIVISAEEAKEASKKKKSTKKTGGK